MASEWHANPQHSLAIALVLKVLRSCAEQIVERDHAHKLSLRLRIQNRKTGQTRLGHSLHDDAERLVGKSPANS